MPATPSWLGRTIVIVRGAPKRQSRPSNYPSLTYLGPVIAIDTDAARAAMIVDRIRSRCPELTRADLLLVARVLTDRQRAEDGLAPSRKPIREPRAKAAHAAPEGRLSGGWGNVRRFRRGRIARRPELRARSDPCIVCLKRG